MHSEFNKLFKAVAALLGIFSATVSFSQSGIYRFPSVNESSIVFTCAGDLYIVPIQGGEARQLTSHDGMELFAHFNPGGDQIAFTGQFDGNTEVYSIPAQGGIPKRLTITPTLSRDFVDDRMGPNNIVFDWTESNEIIYRSRACTWDPFKGELFKVNPSGGPSQKLPFSVAGWYDQSSTGKIAYASIFREFRTWKGYRGGMASEVMIFDTTTKESQNISNNKAQDLFPMWHKDQLYYVSDRSGRMNIYKYNHKTGLSIPLTKYADFDVKFPSIGPNHIVYELAGKIILLDLKTEQIKPVDIQINNEFRNARPERVDPTKFITSVSLAPNGKRAVVSTRGELLDIPSNQGYTLNLTKTSGIREREARWSPDGKMIAFISDASGEDEIYIRKTTDSDQNNLQLTFDGNSYKHGLQWSPDSKKLLWTDRKPALNSVDLNGTVEKITTSDVDVIRHYTVSPDSRWIVYTKEVWQGMSRIYAYDTKIKKETPITDEWYNSYLPAFSPDGTQLFFVSDRDFNPTYSKTEWNHAYFDMADIYFITLQDNLSHPFSPKNDEVKLKKPEEVTSTKEKKKESSLAPNNIDFKNIYNRVIKLPLKSGEYFKISPVKDGIYYAFKTASSNQKSIHYFDFNTKKETKIGDYSNYSLSEDLSTLIVVNHQGKRGFMKASTTESTPEKWLDLSTIPLSINKKEEWLQIYNESHRQYKYFFYDPNLHNIDWEFMGDKYRKLIPLCQHRTDLTYLIGELIGELNVGHAYVGGGDVPSSTRIPLGLLGAELEMSKDSYPIITKILQGANWEGATRSPLTQGSNIQIGDYLISINGIDLKNLKDPNEALIGLANQTICVNYNHTNSSKNAISTLVIPIENGSELTYFNWVRNNINLVDSLTSRQVGYIHIPDMTTHGLNEFAKYFYPQLHKKALIIDDRSNGGGNVSPQIIERLNRGLVMINGTRNLRPGVNPYNTHYGPKIMLTNEYSASDGDIFPYRFKSYKMGKVVGTRTWGGTVGYRGVYSLIDGGYLVRPEFGHYNTKGTEWIIEGHGVEPDIEIQNDPYQEFHGIDAQLLKAIELIQEELKTYESLPGKPEYPKK